MTATERHVEDADLSRTAARLVWKQGLKQSVREVPTRDFADAPIAEFRSLQEQHRKGIIGDFLDGAEKAAEQLNVERYHGILEVVQNADDLGAVELRIAVRSKSRGKQLLF